jgi:hypothetical protein
MPDPIKQLRQFVPDYYLNNARPDREAVQNLINDEIEEGGGLKRLVSKREFGRDLAAGYTFEMNNGETLMVWNDADELSYRLDTKERMFHRIASIKEGAVALHQNVPDDPCVYSFSVWEQDENTRGNMFVCPN